MTITENHCNGDETVDTICISVTSDYWTHENRYNKVRSNIDLQKSLNSFLEEIHSQSEFARVTILPKREDIYYTKSATNNYTKGDTLCKEK